MEPNNEVVVTKDDGNFEGLTVELAEDEKPSVPFALALDLLEFSSPQTRRKAADSIYSKKELYRALEHKKKSCRLKGKFLRAYSWHLFHLCILKEAMKPSAPRLLGDKPNSHEIFQALRKTGFKAEHFVQELKLDEEWQRKAKQLCAEILAQYGEKFPRYEHTKNKPATATNTNLGDW